MRRDGLHKAIEVDEPDLEFFDGAYMPSGRIIAMSNIGYQGVPCVNGSDQVGRASTDVAGPNAGLDTSNLQRFYAESRAVSGRVFLLG